MEVQCGVRVTPDRASDAIRGQRYALQSVAREWLFEGSDRTFLRLAGCHRWQQHASGQVKVQHDAPAQRAYYGGLQTCGSSWCCPVCSAVIAGHRASELQTLLDRARGEYRVQFVTLTARHTLGTPLEPFLASLTAALRRVYSGKAFQQFKERIGYVGAVKGVEVTHGENGWHPHFHCLWLSRGGTVASVRRYLVKAWRRSLELEGLSASVSRGIKVKESSLSAAEYLAKFEKSRSWDLDAELTRGVAKHRTRGQSPWDLLREGLKDRLSDEADSCRQLFVEYARATKGKVSMRYSPGLRALFGLQRELSAEEIMARSDRNLGMGLLAVLDADQWRVVVANDCRAELLEVAGSGDRVKLGGWLARLGIDDAVNLAWIGESDGSRHDSRIPGEPVGDMDVQPGWAMGVPEAGLHAIGQSGPCAPGERLAGHSSGGGELTGPPPRDKIDVSAGRYADVGDGGDSDFSLSASSHPRTHTAVWAVRRGVGEPGPQGPV